jgi:hypothetical protein
MPPCELTAVFSGDPFAGERWDPEDARARMREMEGHETENLTLGPRSDAEIAEQNDLEEVQRRGALTYEQHLRLDDLRSRETQELREIKWEADRADLVARARGEDVPGFMENGWTAMIQERRRQRSRAVSTGSTAPTVPSSARERARVIERCRVRVDLVLVLVLVLQPGHDDNRLTIITIT